MRRRGCAAEKSCFSLLKACDSLPKLLQIKSLLLKSGLHSYPPLLTKFAAAAAAAASSSSSSHALQAAASLLFFPPFAAAPHLYDAFLFNTVIRSHALSGSPDDRHRAVSFFSLMLRSRLLPNRYTFPFLLKACAGASQPLSIGPQIHASAIKFGFSDEHYTQNTLIHMYSTAPGGLGDALKVFDRSPRTSSVTWTAMIGGYVRSGDSSKAVGLFQEMQASGIRPDEVTIIAVLAACADLGALELVRWIGSYVEKEEIPKTLPMCNALLSALTKCGDVDGAIALFERMPVKSVISWTAVIDGFAMHGRGKEAVRYFEAMKGAGVKPDGVVLVSLLTACCHTGMVDEGSHYFDSMKNSFGIEPKIEHYGCMVDLFGRAGLVERAIGFVENMPIEPNPVIWRSLIGACRIHGMIELGESITKRLVSSEPMQGPNYVVLSNFYALTKRWDKKWETRKLMSERGLKKIPGCSLVELDGEIYEFTAGDESHAQYKEIYFMLKEIERKLKMEGYVPMTSELLLDVDEEDKEDAMHWHSEKLAIAFAILRTPPGTSIRIVKNLRVCGDCHAATKFISKAYNREILVRDRSRFHCFKNGFCSCNDFW